MVIGVGIDIQEISNMEKAIKRGKEKFLQRTFTRAETGYCLKQRHSAQHFTGRFCAKEAFFKALGTGWSQGVKWNEVEVRHTAAGRPVLHVSGKTAKLCSQAGVKKMWLSLSHSQAYAAAAVVLER